MLFFLSILLLLTTIASTSIALRNKSLTFFKAPEALLDISAAQSQGEFLAHLILNRTQTSIGQREQQLQPWVSPSYVFDLNKELRKQEQEMIAHGTDFEWSLVESTVEQLDSKNVRVYLKGNVSEYLQIQDEKKQLVQKEPTTFVMDLTHKNGKLLLNNLSKESKSV
jgi:hypothetical protein